jgi:predicted enzyme related to lactoylglutathione lyase
VSDSVKFDAHMGNDEPSMQRRINRENANVFRRRDHGAGEQVERALRFYVDQVGFALDVDYSPNHPFRVVQLTPPGSSCSIQLGKGLTDAPVGSLRNVYLVVTDIEATRRLLQERGVDVGEIRHKTPIWCLEWRFRTRAGPSAWRLRELCQLQRSRWQQLGTTGTELAQ